MMSNERMIEGSPLFYRFALFLALSLWGAVEVSGETRTVSSREQLVRAVMDAQPGTTILIAPGTYAGGLHFHRLRGEPGRSIILSAADKQRPPLFRGGNSAMQLSEPEYVELRHLVMEGARGNGLNIDDGGTYDTPARHIVLRGLVVRDVGPEGNRDGIKLSGVDEFRVEDCTIERWGSAGSGIDMVGCHDGVISGCELRDRSGNRANGIQTKGGSSGIRIRRCRFEQTGGRGVNIGGSTGPPYFRPADAGYEARDIQVEDCTFVGTSAPICFVGVDGAIARYNTVYRPQGYVVRILQESRGERFVPSRNGVFANNLVAFRSGEIRGAVNVGPGTAPETFQFAGNHWYCLDAPRRSRLPLPVEEKEGSYGTDPQFMDAANGDVRLRAGSPVRELGVRPVRDGR